MGFGFRMGALKDRWPFWLGLAAVLWALSPTPAPRQLNEIVRAARMAWQSGSATAALIEMERAIELEPTLGAGLELIAAQAALRSGDSASALAHAGQALQMGASVADIQCVLLVAALIGGDDTLTAEVPFDAWKSCELDSPSLRSLAELAMARGDWETAGSALDARAESHLDDPEAQLDLGLFLAVEDPEAAPPYLHAAIAGAGGDPSAEAVLAELQTSRGAGQADLQARIGLALARQGRWRLAERALELAVEASPDFASAHAYLGLARDQLGADGGPELQVALRLSPLSPIVHAFLGRHWQGVGNLAAARMEFEKVAMLDDRDPAVMAQLGEVYAAMGDLEAAEMAFRAAVERAPLDPSFWLLLAQHSLQREIEIDTLGIPAARQAVHLDPSLAAGWDALGYGHALLGETDLADRLLRLALSLDPARASTHYHLGLVFHAQGNSDAAALEWRTAMDLDPGGPFGALARRALGFP
ncbi:MAG: tetratricopeptide repeat protein [Anaerolineales bacterium]